MTLLQIISIIKKIALSQPNIHSCVDEFLSLNDITAKYSAVILQQQTHRRNNDFISFNFYLGYSDRLNEDKSNEIEIQSTGIQVINSIVYKLEDLGFDCSMGSYNVFTQRFLAEAAGCYTELIISIPIGECTDDFSKEELNATITANGVYSWIPKGLGFENVKINVDVAHLQDKSLDITKNGNYKVQYDKGFSGLKTVDVNVSVPTTEINNQIKDELITVNNKKYTYTPDKDYTGIGELNVMVQIPEQPIYEEGYNKGKEDGINEQKRKLADIEIVENGSYSREDGYGSITVDVPIPEINNQEKSITINSNGTSSVVPDAGYTGLSKMNITVNVPTSGGGEFDLTSLGYTAQQNTTINTDIQNTIPYSQSLLENYNDEKIYEHDSYMMFAPLFPCGNRTNFDSFFSECGSLTSIPLLDFSKGDSFKHTFWYCCGLREIPLLDFSKGKYFNATFSSCESLQKLPLLDFSNGWNFDGTFHGCANLQTFPPINVSNGGNFDFFLAQCLSLTHVSALDTQRSTTFRFMFYEDAKLTTIDELNFSNGQNFTQTFDWCTELTDITFVGSINKSIYFGYSTKLSYNSIKSILTACSKTTNSNSKTVSFNRTITDQNQELTNLVASCTSKGWEIQGLRITTA